MTTTDWDFDTYRRHRSGEPHRQDHRQTGEQWNAAREAATKLRQNIARRYETYELHSGEAAGSPVSASSAPWNFWTHALRSQTA